MMSLFCLCFAAFVAPVLGMGQFNVRAFLSAPAPNQKSFRGRSLSSWLLKLSGNQMKESEVRERLQEALGNIDLQSELNRVESLIGSTFESMPRSAAGRLGPHAIHHIMHSYFSQQYGWNLFSTADFTIKNRSGTGAQMLQAKIPILMEAVLEAREHGRGLTLSEVAAIVTAVEHLIFDESVNLLQYAYKLNGLDPSSDLNADAAKEVLISYTAVFRLRRNGTLPFYNPALHMKWKSICPRCTQKHAMFVEDSLLNFDFDHSDNRSPFATKAYTFEALAVIVDRMSRQYGYYFADTCKNLRVALEESDVNGTGRLSLEEFRSMKQVGEYSLEESDDELREIGALDESIPGKPLVRITNYVLSDTNCDTPSEYYNVCCFNTCRVIMQQLERAFKAPTVLPEPLLAAVSNISEMADKDMGIAALPFSGASLVRMQQSLEAISQQHDGKVPLHGRSFATWLHFAFPRDCPFPKQPTVTHVTVEALKKAAPQEWASDMEYVMPAKNASWAQEDDVPILMDMEILNAYSASPLRTVLRFVAILGAALAFWNIGFDYIKAMVSAVRSDVGRSKKEDNGWA